MGSWTFYGKFTAATLGPVLVIVLLFLFHRVHVSKLPPGSAIAHHQLDRTLKIGFTFIFLVYPTICQTVFQTFKCQQLSEEHECLSVDFQTDCTTAGFAVLQVIALLMVVAFPIGIPASLFFVMWRNRAELAQAGSEKREEFAPLVEAYKPDCWYW